MTREEINQIIHSAMGLCWHEFPVYGPCRCGEYKFDRNYSDGENKNPSYTSSWEAYGELLEWAQKEKWFGRFINRLNIMSDLPTERKLFNPLRGSTALATFIEDHPEIFRKEKKGE